MGIDLSRAADPWGSALSEATSDQPNATVSVGRKRAASTGAAPTAPPSKFKPEDFHALSRMVLDTACMAAGVSEVTETEVKRWSEAFVPVWDKYIDQYVGEHMPLAMLTVVTASIAAPRVKEYIDGRESSEPDATDERQVETVEEF